MKLKEFASPKFKVNPLLETICQLKFPPIFKVRELPSQFQERIREEYPNYTDLPILAESVPSELKHLMANFAPFNPPINHTYSNSDNSWFIILNVDSNLCAKQATLIWLQGLWKAKLSHRFQTR